MMIMAKNLIMLSAKSKGLLELILPKIDSKSSMNFLCSFSQRDSLGLVAV